MSRDSVPSKRESATERIRQWIEQTGQERPVTDVYVFSHGWHRNLLGAVSAYDRLMSRIAVLLKRGRLPTPPGYHPIFIALHWHSEIGKDGWVDLAGRRHKADFLARARTVFACPDERVFVNDFEDIFELMQTMSAPDVDAYGTEIVNTSEGLAGTLDKHEFRIVAPGVPAVEHYDKVVAVWTCYFEAQPRQLVKPQAAKPRAFLSIWQALGLIVSSVLSFAGVTTALMWALSKDLFGLNTVISRGWMVLVGLLQIHLGLPSVASHCVLGALATCLVLVWFLLACNRKRGKVLPDGYVAWAIVSLPLVVLLLVACLLTFLAGTIGIRGGLYSEKSKRAGLLYRLSRVALWPTTVLRATFRRGERASSILDLAASQLSFWRMQRNAVGAAEEAAKEVIPAITKKAPQARLHLIGHSFGGLLVANLARSLKNDIAIQTLCIIEGGLAASWLEEEDGLVKRIAGTLAAIYSRYDTAVGCYYPFSNGGRIGMGSVGMTRAGDMQPLRGVPDDSTIDCETPPSQGVNCLASLVRPPILPGGTSSVAAINIDASRLIYEGPPMSGGGHDDLYKDDVVHLLWAVAHRDVVSDVRAAVSMKTQTEPMESGPR